MVQVCSSCRLSETHTLMQDFADIPQVDQIEVLEPLGAGATSRVYRARQTTLDRLVALKILNPDLVAGEELLRRFQQEARISSSLDHPNIVRTLSFGVARDGRPYLVMELLEGHSLSDLLSDGGALPLGKFKDVFLSVLSALSAAHEAGLVHRDIKPANIMFCKLDGGREAIKLVDFGIAKVVDSQAAEQCLTKTGVLLGSPNYMSPEQCKGARLDGRSDLYSLCCVMYEALCGEPPYSGSSALEVMRLHSLAPPPTVSELTNRVDVSRELASVIIWGLCKDPSERPQSADELASRLNAVFEQITMDRVPRLKKVSAAGHKGRLAVVALLCLVVPAVIFLGRQQAERTAVVAQHESSLHDLETEAGKKAAQAKYDEALSVYEQAIRKLENSRPVPKKEIARLIFKAFQLPYGDVTPGFIEKLVEFADKGMNLSLEMSDERVIVSMSNQDLFSFLSSMKGTLLQRLGRKEDSCRVALAAISTSDRKWGKQSEFGMRVRTNAANTLLNGKETDQARAVVEEGLSLIKDDRYLLEKTQLQGQLAVCCLQEERTGEFLDIFSRLKNLILDRRQTLSVNEHICFLETLTRLYEASSGLGDLQAVASGELNTHPEYLENRDYAIRLAHAFLSVANRDNSAGRKKLALKNSEQALRIVQNFQDREAKLMRLNALKALVSLCGDCKEPGGAARYESLLKKLQ
jgi:serine/threonine protein kinase